MKFQWRPEHKAQIKKKIHNKASHRLSKMFRDAKITRKCPYWIGDFIWNRLLEHWNSPSYHNKCAIAQKNRALEKLIFARDLASLLMKGLGEHM